MRDSIRVHTLDLFRFWHRGYTGDASRSFGNRYEHFGSCSQLLQFGGQILGMASLQFTADRYLLFIFSARASSAEENKVSGTT